nr:hypothetical protein [Tanacetum cinerariifolium]
MSMIGEMMFFLGLQVNQSPCGIFINQSKYVLEMLNKYRMESCDPVGIPMEIKDKLDLDQNGTPVDATKYRSMIGALMYLTSNTFKSTSGGAQFLGEKLVSWSLKKQDCTALSTAEAEYVSLSACSRAEGIYPGTLPLDRVEDLGGSPLQPPSTKYQRVILFSIHGDEWKSFQSQHQTALRIKQWRYNHTSAESKFKTPMLDHQDKHKMKAQVHVSKSSANSDVQPPPRRKHYCQIYQVVKHMLRGRLLASFQDRENEGGDTRS